MPLAAPVGPARWSASSPRRRRAGPNHGSAAAAPGPRTRTSPKPRAPRRAGKWMELLGGEIN
eukprot:13408795-Alexandrium_andersonii.AAC.1